jgi:hypothetical protein
MLINQEQIDKAGGDWGEYGEVTGQALLDLITEGKLSVVFGNNSLLVGVTRPDGTNGVYNLPHQPFP